jgi:hypothetical protein
MIFLQQPQHIIYVFGVEKSHQSSGGISFCIWASSWTCHFTSCCCFVFHVYIYAIMLWGSFAHEHVLHHAYLLLELSSCDDMFYFELNKLVNMPTWIYFAMSWNFTKSESVNETCYVYMGAIISSDPFWLMASKGLLFYSLSRIMPCLVLIL